MTRLEITAVVLGVLAVCSFGVAAFASFMEMITQ